MIIFEGKFDTTNLYSDKKTALVVALWLSLTVISIALGLIMYYSNTYNPYVIVAFLVVIVLGFPSVMVYSRLPMRKHISDNLKFDIEDGVLIIKNRNRILSSFKIPVRTESFRASTLIEFQHSGAEISQVDCLKIYNSSKSFTIAEETTGNRTHTRSKLIKPDAVANKTGTINLFKSALDEKNGNTAILNQHLHEGVPVDIPKDINF